MSAPDHRQPAGGTAGRRPEIGDLVRLPAWVSPAPYRVLGVRDASLTGWVSLSGYEILAGGRQLLVDRLVPVAQLAVYDRHWLP